MRAKAPDASLTIEEIFDLLNPIAWRSPLVVQRAKAFASTVTSDAAFDWRLHLVLSGTVELRERADGKVLGTGDAILEPPGFSADFSSASGSILSFELQPGILRIRIADCGASRGISRECHQSWPESAVLRDLFTQLKNAANAATSIKSLEARGLVWILAARLCEVAQINREVGQRQRHAFVRLKAYVYDRMADDYLSLDAAKDLGFSVQYLNSLTKQHRGMSLNAFITFCRLEAFREALTSTNLKVCDLAPQFGFADSVYLIQLFRRTYGLPPKRLRKRLAVSLDTGERLQLHAIQGFEHLRLQPEMPERVTADPKDPQATLLVGNTTNEPIVLYWLAPQGRVPIKVIGAHQRRHLGADDGHLWMVATPGETPIGYCRTSRKSAFVVV